jgi:hypothetical protein
MENMYEDDIEKLINRIEDITFMKFF